MKPIMVRKKKNMLKNSLILFIFFLLISVCFWKMYIIYEQCLRIYFITGHMKKKALTFLNLAPSAQEIHTLREKIKEATKQKRKYLKKRDNAYILIDWYLYVMAQPKKLIIEQVIFNKKTIKMSVKSNKESDIEELLQYIVKNLTFKKAQVRSCEKTTNQISCEIYIATDNR